MADTLLTRLKRDELPEDLRPSWDYLNDRTGEPTFVEVFANAPELLTFVMHDFYQKIFYEGRVKLRYKELIRLRLALAHGCNTCIKQNIPGCLEAGFSREQIDSVEDFEVGPFDDAEKAALALTEQMALTNPGGYLSPELYDRLKRYFTDPEILELATCMAVIGGMGKLSFVFNLVEQVESCPFAPAAE